MSRPLWSSAHHAEKGQALVIIALAMSGLIAFLGLVTDIGWGLSQRRLAQNAADGAALAGAHTIAKTPAGTCVNNTLQSTIDALVPNYVHLNAGDAATSDWHYVDNSGVTVATGSACTSATGVTVNASVPYHTFILSIIGITDGSTSATATARVQILENFQGGSPFIACGSGLVRSGDGALINVLDTTTTPVSVNKTYIDDHTVFNLAQPDPKDVGNCGYSSGNFKGLADDAPPDGPQLPCDVMPCYQTADTGTHSGPFSVTVAGATPGCSTGILDKCILFVPLADGVGIVNSKEAFHIVVWAAFYVEQTGSNKHTGILQGNVLVRGTGGNWDPGDTGILIISLVE